MEHNASILDISYFLERFGKGKEFKLLDIGCADGKKFFTLLDKKGFEGATYIGLDSVYWDADSKFRPTSSGRMTFVYGDACNLPFPDNSFDLVMLSHVFEHIENSEGVCAEINRVIKKDGKILIIVPLEGGGFFGFLNKNRNLWKHLRFFLAWIGVLPYHIVSPHVHFKSYEEYLAYFSDRFEVVESYARGSLGMLTVSFLHETLMGFARQKIDLILFIEKHFPKFFHNTYKKNKHFKMDATFILAPKKK